MVFENIKKFIFPSRCVLCDKILPFGSKLENMFLCEECKGDFEFIKEPTCKKCGAMINDKDEIKAKTIEFTLKYESLSTYDCLCMAYAFIDGYCLITDDKTLQKKCVMNNIEIKTSEDIVEEFLNGGDDYVNMKK